MRGEGQGRKEESPYDLAASAVDHPGGFVPLLLYLRSMDGRAAEPKQSQSLIRTDQKTRRQTYEDEDQKTEIGRQGPKCGAQQKCLKNLSTPLQPKQLHQIGLTFLGETPDVNILR